MTEHPSPRAQLKHQIDRMLLHDFQALRERPSDLNDLMAFKQNSVMMQYIKQIYNEYNLPNPLLQINLSCLSSSPSGVKTIKKPKINLMSSQTLKYSVTPRKFYEDHEDPIDYSTYEHDHSSRLCFYHNTTHSSLGHLYREAREQQLNKTSLIDLNYHYQCQGGRKMHVCDSEESQMRMEMMIEVQERVEMHESVDNLAYVLPCSPEEDRSSACSSQSPSNSSLEEVQSNECRTPQKPAGFSHSLANSAKTRAFSSQFNTKPYFGQSNFMDSEYSEGQ